MLKITILTCAIITMPPVFEAALAGDPVPASLDSTALLLWTGRFVDVARAPATMGAAVGRPPAPARGDSDPEIVGSIPPDADGRAYVDRMLTRGTPDVRSCIAPAQSTPPGQDLACGGVANNRWSAKVEHFNYDLSAADMNWINPLLSDAASPPSP